ncbi:sugar phosphate isomerase/epimerase [Kribbella sp. NPDC023855]|uniref:sugar phosphate isomerase/epimerase family protein n=1 Tax=Kribbella sp. NPDC023855 TaxID=3154698 RepID=UPI0033C5768E
MSDRTIPADGIGMHLYTMREALAADYPGTLQRLAEIGYRTVGVSGRFGHSAEEIRSYADNHGHDFAEVDGQVLFDILLDEVEPDLLGFELDLYWVVDGGKNPADYFRRHPGRFPALHVKDMAEDGSFADVGTGTLDFAAIFAEAESGGVEQWLVEHDAPVDEWESARTSYRSLVDLRY